MAHTQIRREQEEKCADELSRSGDEVLAQSRGVFRRLGREVAKHWLVEAVADLSLDRRHLLEQQ